MPTSIDRDPGTDDVASAAEPSVPHSSTRRRLLQGAAGTLVLALTPHLARGASLLAVRVWPSAEYTRVAIEHDTALRFHYFLLQDRSPQRLVVDIRGVDFTRRFAEQIRQVDPHDPFIARMRVGQYRPGVVRLVVELKAAVNPQVFRWRPRDRTATGSCWISIRPTPAIRCCPCCVRGARHRLRRRSRWRIPGRRRAGPRRPRSVR